MYGTNVHNKSKRNKYNKRKRLISNYALRTVQTIRHTYIHTYIQTDRRIDSQTHMKIDR